MESVQAFVAMHKGGFTLGLALAYGVGAFLAFKQIAEMIVQRVTMNQKNLELLLKYVDAGLGEVNPLSVQHVFALFYKRRMSHSEILILARDPVDPLLAIQDRLWAWSHLCFDERSKAHVQIQPKKNLVRLSKSCTFVSLIFYILLVLSGGVLAGAFLNEWPPVIKAFALMSLGVTGPMFYMFLQFGRALSAACRVLERSGAVGPVAT